jgi:pyridinium-3,5-biscarboxylic acid mononucleotide sulfurtransferase
MKQKLKYLTNELRKFKRALIAFSGGVDSSFLLNFAVNTLGKNNVTSVTAISETYPAEELRRAKRITKKLGVSSIFVKTSELNKKNFYTNPKNRCYYCKDELFGKLAKIAKKTGSVLCDATNYSDRTDFRPGRIAAKKWKVASPLEKAKITKSEIRALSKKMKLETWNLPAQACLASRVPYGTRIEKTSLKKIEKAEAYLRTQGFAVSRVRHHGNIARIEVDKKHLRKMLEPKRLNGIVSYLKKLGWQYITLDIEGYRTGSLNIS